MSGRARAACACLMVATLGSACSFAKDGDPCRLRQTMATEHEVRALVPDGEVPFASPPTCSISSDGAAELTFIPPPCNPLRSWWAGCAFAQHQDLQVFENTGGGVYVAKVCVENLPRAEVNLRYGPVNKPSKFLSLLSSSSDELTSTCLTLYLGIGDSCYDANHCGSACVSGMPISSVDGGITSEVTCSEFSDSEFVLMTEWCQGSTASQSTASKVRLESLVYFPSACRCHSDSDCASPNICRADGWPDSAGCRRDGTGCPAICAAGVPAYP